MQIEILVRNHKSTGISGRKIAQERLRLYKRLDCNTKEYPFKRNFECSIDCSQDCDSDCDCSWDCSYDCDDCYPNDCSNECTDCYIGE